MIKEDGVSGQIKNWVFIVVAAGLLAYPPVQAATKVYYIHSDHLGTPQAMTDASQTVVWLADYQPFGEAVVNEDPDGDGVLVEMPLRFVGQYYDKETGLHYNYFRDYDPRLGRYIQSDPIGLRGGLNTYVYVKGNPIRFVDPLGLMTIPPPTDIPGGPWTPHPNPQRPGQWLGPKPANGPRPLCQYVPPAGQGGPPGSVGYFKTNTPGQKGWQRYSTSGQPISAAQAHKIPTPKIGPFFFIPNTIFTPLLQQIDGANLPTDS